MEENVLTLAMLRGMVRGGLEVRVVAHGQAEVKATFKRYWDAYDYFNCPVLMFETNIRAETFEGSCGYSLQAQPFLTVYVADK